MTTKTRRLRADITVNRSEDMYYHVHTTTSVKMSPTGPALTSMTPSGLHAPALDVDMPVKVEGSSVTFTGKFNPETALKALSGAIDAGLLHESTRESLSTQIEAARARLLFRFWGVLRQDTLTVTFPYPVVALRSKSAYHYHLFCQSAMPWEDATALMGALASARLVDPRFKMISSKGDFMFVWREPSEHDDF